MILILSALLFDAMQTAPPVRVEARWDGKQCGARLEGRMLDEAQLSKSAAKWARKKRQVRIVFDEDTPYRCIGATLYTLQRNGVAILGFVSEPDSVRLQVAESPCRAVADGQVIEDEQLAARLRAWEAAGTMVELQLGRGETNACAGHLLERLKAHPKLRLGFTGNETDPPGQ